MKTLYLVRHAKSSWDNPNQGDFDRPLNRRGEKAAPFMAKLMQQKSVNPDLILSSPANRALTTAEIFCETLGYPPEKIEQRIEIYEGGLNHMLQLVQQIPDNCTTAMLLDTILPLPLLQISYPVNTSKISSPVVLSGST